MADKIRTSINPGSLSALALALTCLVSCIRPEEAAGPASAPAPDRTMAPAAAQAAGPAAQIDATEVAYSAGGTSLKGYLAAPRGSGKHPGILVVHEWWGPNEYVRRRARELAQLGYVALAVDMYGDGKLSDNPEGAKKLAGEATADPAVVKARLEAARDVLTKDPRTEPGAVGAIGYCFGGGVLLQAARMSFELDVLVSFHGSLGTDKPMAKGAFQGKVLIATGGADPMVPPEHVLAIKKELSDAAVDAEIVVYDGATHAFSNPAATEVGKKFNLPIKYDAKADAESWQKMKALFAQTWPAKEQ